MSAEIVWDRVPNVFDLSSDGIERRAWLFDEFVLTIKLVCMDAARLEFNVFFIGTLSARVTAS